jgi:protein tyrosine/serine phosphatase
LNRHLRRILVGLGIVAVLTAVIGPVVYFGVLKAGFREVAPGVYRSGQPSRNTLRKRVEEYGFKTVLCLRGNQHKDILEEMAVLDELGVRFESFPFGEGYLPHPTQLRAMIEIIETCDKPLLMHCKSGINRVSMAAAVAVMVVGDADFEAAMQQVPLIETNDEPDHITDLLRQYEAWCKANDLDVNDSARFKHWANEIYTGVPDRLADRP